eukprot:TRINITY_DN27287_c0_g1_i1.p1 TRINITY_DN27287_c0_g1~~TRINITY_DN27287_c0_g1_i1.p1  ORF type:complete len:1450 (+),score=456.07 TRINITY_DN27287_c0_g1_i1:44-4393(+)
METGGGGGGAPPPGAGMSLEEQILATIQYYRNLQVEDDDEVSADEGDVEQVQLRIETLFALLQELEADAGARPSEWSEETAKQAKQHLTELCGILHSECELFHEYYFDTLRAGGVHAKRLSRVRKCVTGQFRLACTTIIAAALQPGVDATLSCVALYFIRQLWSSMLDPDFAGGFDPFALGHLRLAFNQGVGMDYHRLLQLATNTEALSGAPAFQRALAANILSTQLFAHSDDFNNFIADKGNAKALLARLRAMWMPAGGKSPRRSAARFSSAGKDKGARPEPLQLPRSAAAGVTPEALSHALANIMSPNAPSADAAHSPSTPGRIVMPLRRNRPGSAASAPAPADGSSAFVQSLPGGAAAGRPVAAVAAPAHTPQPSGAKRVREEGSSAPPATRRRLGDRLRRATGLVRENTLFPKGCNVHAPPPVPLHEIDTLGILSCMCVVSGCQDVLATVLQHSLVELLLILLDPAKDKQRPRHRDIAVSAYHLMTSLLIHKRCATIFVEDFGIEQLTQRDDAGAPGGLAMQSGKLGVLLQLSKMTSVMERYAQTRPALVKNVVEFAMATLELPSKEVKKESAQFLQQILKIPKYLHAFDERPDGLACLVNAIEAATKSTDCSSGLESALCQCLMTYLQAHLLLDMSAVWPNYRRHAYPHANEHKSLPMAQWGAVLTHFDQPLHRCKGTGPSSRAQPVPTAPDGSDTGFTLLTSGRLPAYARVGELGIVAIVLQLVSTARRWGVPATLNQVLELLETLAVAPFLHSAIVTTGIGQTGISKGLGLLLDVASDEGDEGHQPQKHINARALNIVRAVMTPPSYDDRTLPSYQESWRVFREYNGLRVLLAALTDENHALGDKSVRDKSAFICTRILLSMLRGADPTLRSDLAELGVPKLLFNRIDAGPVSDATRGEFGMFAGAARMLAAMIAGGSADVVAADMEHAVQRLEKARVVQNTNIHYSQRELQEIIHNYFVRQNLPHAAAALRLEAGLDAEQPPGRPAAAQRPLHELDDVVQTFLRKQQMDCTNPVSTLPPFSLRKGTQPALRVPEKHATDVNVATRVRKAMLGHKTKAHAGYHRKLVHSNIHRSDIIVKGDHYACVQSIGFSADGQDVLVGHSSGSLVRHRDQEDWKEFDLGNASITGIRTSRAHPVICIWEGGEEKLRMVSADDPLAEKWTLENKRAALFGNHNDDIVVTTSGDSFVASVVDLETKQQLAHFYRTNATPENAHAENALNLACTNYDDSMLLSDCILYDVRANKSIHRYDKLAQHTRGIFSTSQNEVIIDKWVWDIRTHKMLRTVPSLSQTFMDRGPHGNVIYGARREIFMNEDREPSNSILSVVDGLDYDHISTLDMTDWIEDFAADPLGLTLGVVLSRKAHGVTTESVAKIFYIGKQKLNLEDWISDNSDDEGDDSHEEEHAESDDSGTTTSYTVLGGSAEEESDTTDSDLSSGVTIDDI